MQKRLKNSSYIQKNTLKPISELEIKDNFLNLLKHIYKKSISNIIINNMFKTFSLGLKNNKFPVSEIRQ